ncbi:MAG: hypothetical protein FD124_2052 [Alphaproteobacteria bacterium]|nr:MAG: hypothetical protein FD124_2052 [Alphaproteobacteria bacterium]
MHSRTSLSGGAGEDMLYGGGPVTAACGPEHTHRGFWGRLGDFFSGIGNFVGDFTGIADGRPGLNSASNIGSARTVAGAFGVPVNEVDEIVVNGQKSWNDFWRGWNTIPYLPPQSAQMSATPSYIPVLREWQYRQSYASYTASLGDGMRGHVSVFNSSATNLGLQARGALFNIESAFQRPAALLAPIDATFGRGIEAIHPYMNRYQASEGLATAASVMVGNPEALAAGLGPRVVTTSAARGAFVASIVSVADEAALIQAAACFVAGTLVHTKEGLKPIEQIEVGDLVLAQPEFQGARSFRRVLDTFQRSPQDLVQVTIADGARQETITATLEHPFWVVGTGWVGAGELRDGQSIELADGRNARLAAVERLAEKLPVFNFAVEGFHTYYVGELGIWVHNASRVGDIRALGVAGEEASEMLTGLSKNTTRIPSVSGAKAYRVPDHLDPITERYIGETKNVARQSLTTQILDDAAHVTRGGWPGRVDVMIDDRTVITGPLLREHLNPGSPIKLRRVDLNPSGE